MQKKEVQNPSIAQTPLWIKWGYRLLITLNIGAGILLLLCFWSIYASENTIGLLLALTAGIYPILLIINVLFLGLWFVLNKKIKYTAGLFVLIGSLNFSSFYKINLWGEHQLSSQEVKLKTDFKVLTYNVRLFNLYNWLPEKGIKDSMVQMILNEDAQIIALQESYKEFDNEKAPINLLQTGLKNYYLFDGSQTNLSGKNLIQTGNCILSKYPITNTGVIDFEQSNNTCIFADVQHPKKMIRVYNIHLQSFHFNKRDVQLLNALKKGEPLDTKTKNLSLEFLKKLESTYLQRASQVDLVLKHIQESPYPVLVVGDFNDPPISQTYNRFHKILLDSFEESGRNTGATYNGKIPFFRIDYLWYDNNFQSYNHSIHRVNYSDHFPVSAYFKIKD